MVNFMISENIDAFLEFLRDCESQFKMAEAEEQEANAATNDINHFLELEEHDETEILRFAKELIKIRRQRRDAKNKIETLGPVLSWIDENMSVIKGLERLLGEVRKVERKAENRAYVPRIDWEKRFGIKKEESEGVGND